MTGRPDPRRGIKDVFYETRVLRGREYTLRRFATELLGGSIDPVMLGYIEKGKRFPSEALVRRLAAIRREDPHDLLALLWRDRMLYGFGKELRRVLNAPQAVAGVDDAELAVLVSQAIAALPDDGTWISLARWRRQYRQGPDKRSRKGPASEALAKQVESLLRERELVEGDGRRVRRRGRHFVAGTGDERRALALEFFALFAKGLLDKLVLPDGNTGTYLRNHYLHLDKRRIQEFHQRLDDALRGLSEEFAADKSADSHFFNVLVTATPF